VKLEAGSAVFLSAEIAEIQKEKYEKGPYYSI